MNNGQTRWVAFFVSGKTYASTYPSIYMINIEDGSLINNSRVILDDTAPYVGAPDPIGGVPSGQPAVVDSDSNGYLDRLYVGTDKGYMYKVNIPDLPLTNPTHTINHCIINSDFIGTNATTGATETVSPSWHFHPIYGNPAMVADNSVAANGDIIYNIRVFFGTSDSPYIDEGINTATTRYHFYAYIDSSDKGVINSNVNLEWFLQLDAGHRVFASAFAAAGQIYFGTSTAETEDPCAGFVDPSANLGKIYAFTSSGTQLTITDPVLGNIANAPLVDDEHLYIRAPDGLKAMGSGSFNNQVVTGGFSSILLRSWREIRN